jgi:sugar lactone lactonase YvrE
MKKSLKFLTLIAGAATLLGAGFANADIYVTDNTSDQLTIIGAGGTLTNVSNPISQTFLNSPTGIAVDTVSGSQYFGDVFLANSVGTIVTYNPTTQTFGTFATGLSSPEGLAFDSAGNLYVASNVASGSIAQYSGLNLTTVNSTYGSAITNPFDVTATGAGQLYVTSGVTGLIKQIAAGGGAATSFTPSVAPATPAGIVIGPNGDLYVVNTGTPNVEQIKVNGNSSTAVATSGGNLNTPEGLVFDAAGDLYVADFGNNTVTEYGFGSINQLGQTTYNYLQTFGPSNFDGPLFLAFDPVSSAVPEPGTYAMLLGGLAALYFVQRRRSLTTVKA